MRRWTGDNLAIHLAASDADCSSIFGTSHLFSIDVSSLVWQALDRSMIYRRPSPCTFAKFEHGRSTGHARVWH